MLVKISFFVITLFFISNLNLFSQGCSDAGFCSMSGLDSHLESAVDLPDNRLSAGISYGLADNSIDVISVNIEYIRFLSEDINVNFKLCLRFWFIFSS